MIHEIIVIIAFSFSFGVMIYKAVDLKRKGIDFIGQAPINKSIYLLGKIAIFSTWFICFFSALGIRIFIDFTTPQYMYLIGILILIIGVYFIVLPFFQLKSNLKMGLGTEDKGNLITSGIYSYSRNPMYLGFYLTCIASMLCVPGIINIICASIAIVIHHSIVKFEELCLEQQFGDEWVEYRNSVRRYL